MPVGPTVGVGFFRAPWCAQEVLSSASLCLLQKAANAERAVFGGVDRQTTLSLWPVSKKPRLAGSNGLG